MQEWSNLHKLWRLPHTLSCGARHLHPMWCLPHTALCGTYLKSGACHLPSRNTKHVPLTSFLACHKSFKTFSTTITSFFDHYIYHYLFYFIPFKKFQLPYYLYINFVLITLQASLNFTVREQISSSSSYYSNFVSYCHDTKAKLRNNF